MGQRERGVVLVTRGLGVVGVGFGHDLVEVGCAGLWFGGLGEGRGRLDGDMVRLRWFGRVLRRVGAGVLRIEDWGRRMRIDKILRGGLRLDNEVDNDALGKLWVRLVGGEVTGCSHNVIWLMVDVVRVMDLVGLIVLGVMVQMMKDIANGMLLLCDGSGEGLVVGGDGVGRGGSCGDVGRGGRGDGCVRRGERRLDGDERGLARGDRGGGRGGG